MKKKIIIGLLIFIVVVGMIVFNVNKNSNGDSQLTFGQGKAYAVEATMIEEMPIKATVIVAGHVEEVNKKEVILSSSVVIEKWLVKKGDAVKAGQQLMVVDLTSLEAQLTQLEMSKESQSLQLKKLTTFSSTGDNTSLNIAMELAKINLNSVKALHISLQSLYDKNEVLYQEGIISQNELEGYSKQLSDAATQVTIAELNLKRSEAEAANYEQNLAQSKQSTAVDIDIQNKGLEEIEVNINNLKEEIEKIQKATLSPIEGVITQLNVAEGMLANAMQPVLTVVDTTKLKVIAEVGEYDIKKIALNQKAELSGDAIKEDVVIGGDVTYVEPVATQAYDSGKAVTTVTIEISVTAGSEYLKPGYTLDCEITTEEKQQATIANYDMFKEDKDGSKYVYVIDENNELIKQTVKLGIVSDFTAEIVEGLEPGDMVVINPSLVLKEGSKVKVTAEGKE